MMEMEFEITGWEELIKTINDLPELMAARIQGDGMIAAAGVVRDEAKDIVPVKTGALRDSIRAERRAQTVETAAGRRKVPGAAARVRAGAGHAALLEFGHAASGAFKHGPDVPPYPYLEPAIVSTRDRQMQASRQAMSRSYKKLGRDLATGRTTKMTRRLIAADT